MSTIPPMAQQAIERARRGDLDGALDSAREAVAAHPDDYGLRLFIGMLHSRKLELDEALTHVRHAASLAPRDPVPRIELVRLLIGLGRLDEAEEQLAGSAIPGLEPVRLQAMIHARRDRNAEAAQLFRQLVAADPRDHESWGSLGTCLLASGQPLLAIEPLSRAVQLRPDLRKFREKLLEAQVAAGEGEQALRVARDLALAHPGDAAATLTVARLEDLLGRPEAAVEALRALLARHADHVPALVALAELLERENKLQEFEETIGRIGKLDPGAADLPLLRAQLAFRKGDLSRALELARATPVSLNPGTRFQLIGMIEDRRGNSADAFRAYEQMNRVSDLSESVIANRSQALRNLIDERAAITTAAWVRGWSSSGESAREPAFLIGFPRSGTTLLDTFLMGHGGICIAEEKPMLQAVSAQLGDYSRLAQLDEAGIQALRDRYWQAANEFVGDEEDRLLIDKFPLGAIELPIFHRLFPTAKIILLERHPCDVVLSCFFARFQPTPALISFTTLEDTARLYDKVMSFWEQCRDAMPLQVHRLRYEELIGAPEAQVRQLVAFLGLDWDERVLDHQKVARERAFVPTASYAQVVEPLYDRSIGRWKRYRDQLAPVLPILLPWAERMGYES